MKKIHREIPEVLGIMRNARLSEKETSIKVEVLAISSLETMLYILRPLMSSLPWRTLPNFCLQTPSLPKFGRVCGTCLHYETSANFAKLLFGKVS